MEILHINRPLRMKGRKCLFPEKASAMTSRYSSVGQVQENALTNVEAFSGRMQIRFSWQEIRRAVHVGGMVPSKREKFLHKTILYWTIELCANFKDTFAPKTFWRQNCFSAKISFVLSILKLNKTTITIDTRGGYNKPSLLWSELYNENWSQNLEESPFCQLKWRTFCSTCPSN